MTQDGKALKCASEEMRGDRAIVLAAVKHNGSALQFASDALKDDRDIRLARLGASAQDGQR